jgi:hypothetical protein
MVNKGPKTSVPPSLVDAHKSDWKDSKPIIAIISGAATCVATSGAFLTFYIPAREADLTTQIKTLEAGRAETDKKLAAKDAELLNAKEVREKLEGEQRAIRSELTSARQAQLFSIGDPYPNGLRAVHVGADISEVQRAYSKATVEKAEGVLVLKAQHNVFSKVSYFFDPEGQDKRITHIVFEIENVKDFDDKFLLEKLRHALGAPQTGSKPMHCAWLKSKAHGVFMTEPHSFMITIEDVKPRAWKPGPRNHDSCV